MKLEAVSPRQDQDVSWWGGKLRSHVFATTADVKRTTCLPSVLVLERAYGLHVL